MDTRTLKLLLNFSRLVGPRSPGNRGLKKHKAAPVPWSSSCGDRGFSRGSSGPSAGPGGALVLREELQNSRKEKLLGPQGVQGGGPTEGKARASGLCPYAFPFPLGLNLSSCATGRRGPLTDAQMGDGFQFLVGGCQVDGSGELEREEKNVPEAREGSKKSGGKSAPGCGLGGAESA